jgi:uncharacterized protein (DUF433 family)
LYSRILTALENKPSLDESLAKYGDLLFEKLAEFLEGKRKGGGEEEEDSGEVRIGS